MSSGSKERRYVRGEEEEDAVYANVESLQKEEDNAVYVNAESLQKATGNQVVQRTVLVELKTRSFRACAVCVTVLCVLLTVGLIGVSTYYHYVYQNVTQERDQWKSRAAQSCSSGWMKFGDSCYYRSAAAKTWEEHRNLCLKTPGADLVIINSQEEQEFIEELIAGHWTASWLGLKRTAGNWTWVDGTPLTQHWDNGSLLNIGDDNCAYFSAIDGKWRNASCSKRVFRMCEKLYVS